jgi:hypothetical protein
MRLFFLFTALLTLSVFSFLRATKEFQAQRAVHSDSTYTSKSQPSGGDFRQLAFPSSVEHIDRQAKTHPSKKHEPALSRNFNHQVETK